MELVDGKIIMTEDEHTELSTYLVARFKKYKLSNHGILPMESFLDQQIRRNLALSRIPGDGGSGRFLFGDKNFWIELREQLGNNLKVQSKIEIASEDPLQLNISFRFEERDRNIID